MTTSNIDTQIAIIQNSIQLFQTAPDVLKSNRDRSMKAVVVGNNIIEQWQNAWSIPDEDERMQALQQVDERSNKYLVNCATALKEEKEVRAAITQMMDEFKKMFTSAENDIDRTKADSVPAKVQEQRNSYAAKVVEIQKRKQREAELAQAKKTEWIELRAAIEQRLSTAFNEKVLASRTKLRNTFNAITLEKFEAGLEWFTKLSTALSDDFFASFNPNVYARHYTADEVRALISQVIAEMKPDMVASFTAQISMERDEIIDLFPSKKQELEEKHRLAEEARLAQEEADRKEKIRQEELKKANDEERERLQRIAEEERKKNEARQAELKAQQEKLEREQREREEAEQQRLALEAEEANRKSQQQIEIKAQGEQTMAMFEKEAAVAESTEGPKIKEACEIAVLHAVGYTQIFQLWFEKTGKDLPIDKMGNTKLDQMKAFCEKEFTKNGTKIESKFLNYTTVTKAVAQKAK